MKSDGLGTLLLILMATAVNATARIRKGKEYTSIVVSAGILFSMLAVTGSLWRWDIVKIMAWLFLVSSIVMNGKPFVDALAQFVGAFRDR